MESRMDERLANECLDAPLQTDEEIDAGFKEIVREAERALEARRIKDAKKRLKNKQSKEKIKNKSESEIQTEILEYLKVNGVFAYRQNNQGRVRFGTNGVGMMLGSLTPGIPDIGGVLKCGTALYIEAKRQGWKAPSDEAMEKAHRRWINGEAKTDNYATHRAQREFQRMARKNGAVVIVAQSVACVARALREHASKIGCPDAYPSA